MPSKQKKQATRGSKQIVEENDATVKFYIEMSAGAFAIYLVVSYLIDLEYSTTTIVLLVLILIVYIVCVNFLKYASKATYSKDKKTIVSSGADLNMDGGIAEDVKDAIIFSALTQILSLASNYFWLLLLLIPIKACYMLWTSVLEPWFFQSNEKPEINEKRQKKADKRSKAVRN